MKHMLLAAFFVWPFRFNPEPRPLPPPAPKPKAAVPAKLAFQRKRWESAKINGKDLWALDQCVALYLRNRKIYEKLESLHDNGVPAPVIFAFHYRESTNNFSRHLHEGSSLQHRTRYVPKGRLPPPKEPPYDFVTSAEDALYTYEKLYKWDWRSLEHSLQASESYNGLGYQNYHSDVPSPYLWSGTNLYQRGKYTSDGKFSDVAVDRQLGVCAILKRMMERGIAVQFAL